MITCKLILCSRSIKHFIFVLLFADPVGIAVSNSTVFFAEYYGNKIFTLGLDGKDKTPIVDSGDPLGLVVDSCVR